MKADSDLTTDVSEVQLREMFDAYAGPERPQTRPRRRRSRRPFALAATAIVALAALAAVFAYDRSEETPSESGLKASGLTRVEASPMHAPFRNIPLDQMIAQSDLIFIGTVAAIEGPEQISPANPPDYPDPILGYRVTFEAEELLRGDDEREIEVTNTMGRGAAFTAEVGEEFLIFAEWKEVGYEHVPRLVGLGIDLGVFRVTGPNTAENSRAVVVHLDEVARLVHAAGAS